MVLSVSVPDKGDQYAAAPAVPVPGADVQSTLLALLSKAATAVGAGGPTAG